MMAISRGILTPPGGGACTVTYFSRLGPSWLDRNIVDVGALGQGGYQDHRLGDVLALHHALAPLLWHRSPPVGQDLCLHLSGMDDAGAYAV
jgi:hypothetical protein